MTRHKNQAKALVDVWDILVRYRWRFILPTFLIMAGVLAMSFFLPRKYQASAIFERRTDMVLAEIISTRGATRFEDPRQAIVEEVTGDPAIDELIDVIRPQLEARSRKGGRQVDLARLRAELPRKVIVKYDIAAPNHDRVRVTYTAQDPELARLVVNTLVSNYIARTRREMDTRLEQSSIFFSNEIANTRGKIEEIENRKLDFEIKHSELLPDGPNSVQALMTDAQAELHGMEQAHQEAISRVETLEAKIDQTPEQLPSVVTGKNPELTRLETKLRELLDERSKFIDTFKMKAGHPDLIALEQVIAQTQAQIASTESEVVTARHLTTNKKRADLELLLATAEADAVALEQQIVAARGKIAQLNDKTVKLFPIRSAYAKLIREHDQAQRQLTFWEDNLRRVTMSVAAESGDRGIRLDFIKPCQHISRPISPNLAQVLMAAIALGLIGGAASVYFAQRTDESVQDGERLAESLGIPLFGSVSEIISSQQRRVRRVRNMILYPVNATVMSAVLLFMAAMLYVDLEKPHNFEHLADDPASIKATTRNAAGTTGAPARVDGSQ